MTTRNNAIDASQADGQWRFTGWMALATILVFFGTTFVANGALVYYALSTFSGEQEASPYEHGLAYDRDIVAARAQDQLGWRVTINARRAQPGATATIGVEMRDAAGKPITGLAVAAKMEFPADKAFDRRASLTELAPGEYRGEAPLRAGQWDIVVEASSGGETRFRSRNRIDLP